jgi:hypothetical protein
VAMVIVNASSGASNVRNASNNVASRQCIYFVWAHMSKLVQSVFYTPHNPNQQIDQRTINVKNDNQRAPSVPSDGLTLSALLLRFV